MRGSYFPTASSRKGRRAALVMPALLLVTTSSLQAQAGLRPLSVVIVGTVADTAGGPIATAVILELVSHTSALSDSAGSFRLQGIHVGMAQLQVRRVGYVPAAFSVLVPAESTLRLAIQLTPLTVRLDSIIVSTSTTSFPGLRANGFFER